jgi:release factor glutamine methyltransferase
LRVRVGELLERAARRLRAGGVASPRLEAALLLEHVTSWDRATQLAHPEWLVPGEQAAAFEALVRRRLGAEPIAYLLGEREFYGHLFKVDRRALIPRPETGLLVELGIAGVARWRSQGIEPRVVEVGTGSGAVAVSLALASQVDVVATELAWPALTLAGENAERLGANVSAGADRSAAAAAGHGRVRLVQTDLLAGLGGPLHVVLANLPYVPSGRLLPPDVRDYEPHVAIFGGQRGTELIERLLHEARPLLAPGSELCVELDEEEQAQPVAALARTLYPTAEITIHQDHGGYDRVVRVHLPGLGTPA